MKASPSKETEEIQHEGIANIDVCNDSEDSNKDNPCSRLHAIASEGSYLLIPYSGKCATDSWGEA
jgi:hypothetical protein